jgi:hypothetical protein
VQGKEKETAFAKTMTEEALELVDVQINIERRSNLEIITLILLYIHTYIQRS